jgi:hypothetical protein
MIACVLPYRALAISRRLLQPCPDIWIHKRDRPVQILDQLGSGEGLPTEAIRAATANRATVTPLLLDAIDRCEPKSRVEENGLFMAFHLLGQWQEKSAYRTIARFLRRPDIGLILDDATTVTSHRVLASVFDGDPRPIYDIIRDPEADEFVRGRAFDALVILVFRGDLDRTAVADFLRAAFDELQPRDMCFVWDGWQGAVALLALVELEPLAREAFRLGFIDEMSTSLKNFEDDLKRACAGNPLHPWQHEEYEPFGDVIEELSGWAGFKPKQHRDQIASSPRPNPWPAMPAHNPFRNVGRNDPCPCGSGKKFKKCCIGKTELPQIASPSDPFDLDDPFDMDEVGEFDNFQDGILDYDPLAGPDPDDWLASDEQERLDAVKDYHRRAGIKVERATLHAVMHTVVENQIAKGDQLPVRRTLLRLMTEGLDRHDAIHAIASVLAVHINEQMRDVKSQARRPEQQSDHDFNALYFSELEELTAESWLRSG